MLLESVPLLKH